MLTVICIAIVFLPVAAIIWGAIQGMFDPPYPDYEGVFEMSEKGVYEDRIL